MCAKEIADSKERYRTYVDLQCRPRWRHSVYQKAVRSLLAGVGLAAMFFLVFLVLPRAWLRGISPIIEFFIMSLPFVGAGFMIHGTTTWRQATAKKRQWKAFAQSAEPVFAWPVMMNKHLMRGTRQPLPGLVLVSFDPATGTNSTEMMQLCIKLCEWADSSENRPEIQFAADLMNDERYIPNHRTQLPYFITKGRDIFACHLMIHPDHLPLPLEEWLNQCPFFTCMAAPGPSGGIEHVPPFLFVMPNQASSQPQVAGSPFIQSLATNDPRLAEIKASAQRDIPEFITRFAQKPEQQIFSVKVPVTDNHGTEHLWINLTQVQDQKISGTVENDPVTVKCCKLGDPIESTLTEIEDLIIFDEKAGKVLLGGYHVKEMRINRTT